MLPVSCCRGRGRAVLGHGRAVLVSPGQCCQSGALGAGQVCWMLQLAVPHAILSRQVHLLQLCCAMDFHAFVLALSPLSLCFGAPAPCPGPPCLTHGTGHSCHRHQLLGVGYRRVTSRRESLCSGSCSCLQSGADTSPRWAVGRTDATGEPDASPGWVTATEGPVGAGLSPGIAVDLLALAPSELLTQITRLWGCPYVPARRILARGGCEWGAGTNVCEVTFYCGACERMMFAEGR